ncbi:MAG: hypothetical protein ACREX8_01840 [Gammaproteobacteria bacterium]
MSLTVVIGAHACRGPSAPRTRWRLRPRHELEALAAGGSRSHISCPPCATTIIGIPLAAGDLKLLPVSINPFGREIVPTDDVRTALAASRRQS